jgi:hypothetical protein
MDKNHVIDYVERLRAKPEHVRRRIAMGTTLGVTGVVTAGWLLITFLSGTLTLTPTSTSNATLATAPGTTEIANAAGQTQNAFTDLLGAVGLANNKTTPAALKVEDAATATATPATDDAGDESATGGNQTVIPF